MKILFAPSNIASFSSILSKSLNKLPDVEAKGISFAYNKYWAFSEEWVVYKFESWRKNPLVRLLQEVKAQFTLLRLIIWADVLHWQWDIKGQTFFNLHYYLIRLFRKPIVVEWVGSELRIPDIVFLYNPYYKQLWNSGHYDYYNESRKESIKLQSRFRKLNAVPAISPEMSLYLDNKIFENHYSLFARIDINEFKPYFPDTSIQIPLIVHTPSAKSSKGTRYVRLAIESLRNKGLQFDYLEINNKSKAEALEAIQKADIFLDQFITGNYGMASCEAMAMGKPVFCYIMKPVEELLPNECPIINVSQENLEGELEKYIKNPELRRYVGKKSRAYAEKYHNADTIAKEIWLLYKALIKGDREKVNQAVSL